MMSKNYLTPVSGDVNWNTAASWSSLIVPATGDETTIQNSSGSINSGLNQAAVLLARLDTPMTFSGSIGQAEQPIQAVTNASQSGTTATLTCNAHGYAVGDVVRVAGCTDSKYNGVFTITGVAANTFTYETASGATTPQSQTTAWVTEEDYLNIGITSLNIGDASPVGGSAAGSGRIKINCGTNQVTAYVRNTNGTPLDTGKECVRLLGTHASNALTVAGGKVGIASTRTSEVATFANVSVVGQSASLNLGVGATITNANVSGGTLTIRNTVSVVTISGGQAQSMAGTYNIGTVYCGPGSFTAGHSNGTNNAITSFYGYPGGTLDLSNNPATSANPFRIGTLYRYPSFKIKLNPAAPGMLVIGTRTDVGVKEESYA